MWIPVSSVGKVFDDGIKDLRFNLGQHQKLNNVLI